MLKKMMVLKIVFVVFIAGIFTNVQAQKKQVEETSALAKKNITSETVTKISTKDNFKLIDFKGPIEAAAGARIHCTVKLEVLSGNPQFPRPGGFVTWGKGKSKRIPAGSFVPWKFSKKQIPGQKLSVTFPVQLPDNLEIGSKATIIFHVFGRKKDLTWIYGVIVTPEGKRADSYKHAITIKKPEKLKLSGAHGSISSLSKCKLLTIPLIKAPVINGEIAKEEWRQAAALGTFVNNIGGKKSSPETRGLIGYDNKNIYLAFICDEPAMDKIKAKAFPGRHDAPIWNNDGIEIFFRPDTASTDYVQFIVDTLNQHYDVFCGDFQGFNPVWDSAVKKSASGWSVEVKIPISAISNQKVKNGTVWQADFFREHESGRRQSAWQATNGQCALINGYGFIIFDSVKAALAQEVAFADNHKQDLNGASSEKLAKVLARLNVIKENTAKWDEAEAGKNYLKLRAELSSMKESYRQLVFAAKHAASGSPLVIQQAEAFSKRPPEKNNAELLNGLKATFLADETRQFAFNVTNISAKTVIFRCSFRYGKTPGMNGRGIDHLRLGLPGFNTKWRTVTGVASADETVVYDVLPENPSGTYQVAPDQTIQCFVSLKPNDAAPTDTHGFLVIHDIDGGNLKPLNLPVDLKVVPVKLADAPDKPFSFGWDVLWKDIAEERPDFSKEHFSALRENGFNVSMIHGLQHLPRPKADKDGNLLGTMNFKNLDRYIDQTQGKTDYYFLAIAIWEKGELRKDFLGLDFYSPAYEKAFKSWLRLVIARLKIKGVAQEKLIINGYDESLGKEAQMIAKWIKDVNPELTTLTDCSSSDMNEVKRMDKYTDIWMPHFKTLKQDALKEFHSYLRNTGKPILTYYYCTGGNEKIKAPYADYILKFWGCYNQGLRGIGYWAAGQYYGDPYYRKMNKTALDTALIYPNENGVSLSRRILAWNRGVQDFKMLKLAEATLKKQNNAEVLNTFHKNVEQVTKYPNDLSKAEAMRQFCRKLLIKNK